MNPDKTNKIPFVQRENILLFLILVFTALAYANSLNGDFNVRDDDIYVTDNPLIKDLEGIKKIPTELYYNGHLPVLLYTYALDYAIWELYPFGYHLSNLLLHLLNIILVFWLVRWLRFPEVARILVPLLFALHPMNVETVSWISERKNLLYTSFYLMALILYCRYVKVTEYKFLIISFFAFVFSALSKWSAFPLPVILLLLDWYFKREMTWRIVIEKIPFFAIPFVSTFLHYQSGLDIESGHGQWDRLFFGFYSIAFYLVKCVFPVNLSTIYPYPERIEGWLPVEYYLAIPFTIVVVLLIGLAFWQKWELRRKLVFGAGFFLINIGMVLHVAMSLGGHVIAADRYVYVPYIGLFLIISLGFQELTDRLNVKASVRITVLLLLAVVLGMMVHARNVYWKDSLTLYNYVISKNDNIPIAYMHRAIVYTSMREYGKAIADYDRAIDLQPDYAPAFYNRGVMYAEMQEADMATYDFEKTVRIDPEHYNAWNYLGLIKMRLASFEDAIQLFNIALDINPVFALAINNRGYSYFNLNEMDKALLDFNKAIDLDKELTLAYLNRGWLYANQSKFDLAISDFNMVLKLEPNNGSAFNNRGWVFYQQGKLEQARNDYERALSVDPQSAYPYFNLGLIAQRENNISKACDYWRQSAQRQHRESVHMLSQFCN